MDNLLEALLRNPRAQARNAHPIHANGRCVVYWMQRAQRPTDNPALDAAVEVANALQKPLAVFLAPRAGYPNATLRAYAFLADGFQDIELGLAKKNALLVFRPSRPSLLAFVEEVQPALVVVDENPMREPQRWREKAAAALRVPLVSVDADAVVPMRLFPKLEFAARTIRPKIHRVWGDFLTPSREPKVKTAWTLPLPKADVVDPVAFLSGLKVDRRVGPVSGVTGGPKQGALALKRFVALALREYDTARNHPDVRGTSELSAFLHFGHLGPRAIANAVHAAEAPQAAKDAYLEELIVRREVALNFVLREPNYDRLSGGPAWAIKELDAQRGTPRQYVYSEQQLHDAQTHDPLWNAGQKEMVLSGRMHGYVRMYWAKKILEWTRSPEEAFDLAVKFNDAYELDGRDPNGYTGISWAIAGRHDRPWSPRRPMFGTVRYMSLASTGKKFNLKAYVARVEALER
jgi:deoxyribodipyrimidine photo-lyase